MPDKYSGESPPKPWAGDFVLGELRLGSSCREKTLRHHSYCSSYLETWRFMLLRNPHITVLITQLEPPKMVLEGLISG